MDPLPPAEVARRWFEVMWNERKSELIADLMAPGAIGHLEGGQKTVGPEGFAAFRDEFLLAVPDLHLVVVKILSDAEEACVHWEASGTHQGAGLGLAPSNRTLAFNGVTWLRVKDGQITEGWDFWNLGGLMQTMSAP
jgi:steroid delta-isomerase-like uncharacterized protein